jgi:hypothetical protein
MSSADNSSIVNEYEMLLREPAMPSQRQKAYKDRVPIKLGYWKIRGTAQAIRFVLEFIEHPYEEHLYEMGDGPDFSQSGCIQT